LQNVNSAKASGRKDNGLRSVRNDDEVLSPSPNRAKLLSENKPCIMSARTESYRAPQLKAIDNKLKDILAEKKNRLMNNMRSPLRQLTSNHDSKEENSENDNVSTSHMSNENKFLKKKLREMQKVINEINQGHNKNSHLEYLKKEVDSKNQTISNLESKLFHSGIDQSNSLHSSNTVNSKQRLKDVIEVEVKSLCTGLVQKVKDNMLPKDKNYMQLLENHESNEDGTIDELLTIDRINNETHLKDKLKDLQSLSHKINLIFNTLLSIANNMEENSLED
jgi:hypothetical protein